MRSVTWTQVAQYIILIISYLVPVVYLSWQLFTIPIPELTYGQLLQQNNAKEPRRSPPTRRRRRRGRSGRRTPTRSTAKLKAGGLSEADETRLTAQRNQALVQAAAPRPARRQVRQLR